ncbi:MAG TPA: endonuclease III [Spirochaetota bacterium]|nr:endonuclease III [Spirochaetota bacterium]
MVENMANLSFVMEVLKKSYEENRAPSVTLIANTLKKPFNILVSTLISLRTKDQVTLKASKKLFEKVSSFEDIQKISEEEISKIIFPAGFYKTKAKRLKEIAEIIDSKFGGVIPQTMEELLTLPGIGRKTANLVLILGFNQYGICVDTHVHRVSNRFGWVATKTPEKTEFALLEYLPKEYWRIINDYLVSYGQTVCKPVSPLCSKCGLNKACPKIGVKTSR